MKKKVSAALLFVCLIAATQFVGLAPEKQGMLNSLVAVNQASGTVISSFENEGKNYSYVLSCSHVIKEAPPEQVPILFNDINSKGVIVSFSGGVGFVVENNEKLDYAILLVETPKKWPAAKTATVAQIFNLKLFDKVYTVGRPAFRPIWVTEGILSCFNTSVLNPAEWKNDGSALGHSASMTSGNSGGPLFTASGLMIGVNSRIGTVRGSIRNEQGGTIGEIPLHINHVALAVSLEAVYNDLGKLKTKLYFGSEK